MGINELERQSASVSNKNWETKAKALDWTEAREAEEKQEEHPGWEKRAMLQNWSDQSTSRGCLCFYCLVSYHIFCLAQANIKISSHSWV